MGKLNDLIYVAKSWMYFSLLVQQQKPQWSHYSGLRATENPQARCWLLIWDWLIVEMQRGRNDSCLVERVIARVEEVSSESFCPDWSAVLIDTQQVVFIFMECFAVLLLFFPLCAIFHSAVWSSGGSVDTSAQTLTRSLWGWPINSIFFSGS